MSLRWHVTKRVLFAVFAVYLVVTVTFAFVALTQHPGVARVRHETARQAAASGANESVTKAKVEEAVRKYKQRHGLDDPLHERYLDWLVSITTLDWGYSHTQQARVTTVLATALPKTLAYVVPAMLLALVGGITTGIYTSIRPDSIASRLLTGGAYLGFGLPNFWLIKVALVYGLVAPIVVIGRSGAGDPTLLNGVVLPGAVLATGLLAGQIRYARAESREYLFSEFVKLLRATGARGLDVARHVLKNAALPLFSLFFADLLGVLVVNVFVIETVLGIRGIGHVGLQAIRNQDMALVLGIALVIAFAGVVGNLLQDLAYLVFDPRVEAD